MWRPYALHKLVPRAFKILSLLVLGACAGPEAIIVLLPNQDGTTGALEIRN